jgi:hypothetical protein
MNKIPAFPASVNAQPSNSLFKTKEPIPRNHPDSHPGEMIIPPLDL